MVERGDRERRGGDRAKSHAATLPELGVTRSESGRWQQVALVPAAVRTGYVEETKADGGEVATSGQRGGGGNTSTKSAALRNSARSTTPQPTALGMEYSNDPRPASPAALDSHPAANLFPLLEVVSPEFGELMDDIREHGLLQPIVLCDGKILDGRNRYRACQHAGVEPRFVEWSGDSPTAHCPPRPGGVR